MFARPIFIASVAVLLSGCATTSFAPPLVNGQAKLADNGSCSIRTGTAIVANTVAGAQALIENYRIRYGCAAHDLANGRQLFQVPSALALAGGALAAALGAGPNVAIATSAGSATLNHGNSYYAPQQKAQMFNAAFNAVLCVKQEASGVTAMDIDLGEKAAGIVPQTDSLKSDEHDKSVPVIGFSPGTQYYQMVGAALQSIEGILAQRLSTVGSYAPDAIASEITQLAKEAKDAEDNKETRRTDLNNALGGLKRNEGAGEDGTSALVQSAVDLSLLQPRLKMCVLRAKLT